MMPWTKVDSTDDLLSQIRDVPLARVIRDDVLSAILRGELQPGERITEPLIAARLGVSRVPVREALRELESSGLVESRKHAGVFVRQLSATEIADLYEMRSVLDAFAGRKAAAAAQPALISVLEQRLVHMDDAAERKDVMLYYQTNLHFHWDIISACENRQMCDIYRSIVQKLHLVRLKNLSTDVGMLSSIREHHAIVDAIRRADAAGCEALMATHVKASQQRLVELSTQKPVPEAPASPKKTPA